MSISLNCFTEKQKGEGAIGRIGWGAIRLARRSIVQIVAVVIAHFYEFLRIISTDRSHLGVTFRFVCMSKQQSSTVVYLDKLLSHIANRGSFLSVEEVSASGQTAARKEILHGLIIHGKKKKSHVVVGRLATFFAAATRCAHHSSSPSCVMRNIKKRFGGATTGHTHVQLIKWTFLFCLTNLLRSKRTHALFELFVGCNFTPAIPCRLLVFVKDNRVVLLTPQYERGHRR